MISAAFNSLIEASVCAPSGFNTQPWRFYLDEGAGRITLAVDEARAPSPLDSGRRMAHIAAGAALENLLRTAETSGWSPQVDWRPHPAVADVQLGSEYHRVQIDPVIRARVTNRRVYQYRDVIEEIRARLERATSAPDGIRIHWIFDRQRLPPLAALIGRAEALLFGEPTIRGAFFANVRFDRPPTAVVEQGLPLAALELSTADRTAYQSLRRLPNWLVKNTFMRIFANKARTLVESASGLCILTALDQNEWKDVCVGQAMQRTWLALTAQRVEAQPMMSLPMLANALEHESKELVASLGGDKVRCLLEEWNALLPELNGNSTALILRFGFAAAPSGRTGRLPVNAVIEETARDVASKK